MDVFQVVKALRVQKPGAVHTVESTIATPFAVTHSVQCYFHRLSSTQCLRLLWCTWIPSVHMTTSKTSEPLHKDSNFIMLNWTLHE